MSGGDIALVLGDDSGPTWLGAAIDRAAGHDGSVAVLLPVGASASDVERLGQAGVEIVHVELLGKTADEHDYHAGREGAFGMLTEVLSRARALDLEVVASTPVTRSNFRSLQGIAGLLRPSRIRAWRLACLRVEGRIEQAEQRIVPRIGMALPHVLYAAKLAREQAVEVFVEGAPLCAMGPFADLRLAHHHQGGYGAACEGCGAQDACGGAHPRYLERFGEGELRRRADVPPLQRSDARDRYAAVFVTPGGRLP